MVGHLNGCLCPVGGNLNKPILRSLNPWENVGVSNTTLMSCCESHYERQAKCEMCERKLIFIITTLHLASFSNINLSHLCSSPSCHVTYKLPRAPGGS